MIQSGNSVLLLDGMDNSLIMGSQGWKERQITQPITENVVRGPRDGFTENIDSNIALICSLKAFIQTTGIKKDKTK